LGIIATVVKKSSLLAFKQFPIEKVTFAPATRTLENHRLAGTNRDDDPSSFDRKSLEIANNSLGLGEA